MNENESCAMPSEIETPPAESKTKTKKRQLMSLWRRDPLTKKGFDGYVYVTAFMLPFLIMLGAYACLGKHPFGNGSVLTLDLQAQYVYYFEALRRLLVEGGSWLYSFERTLGGEMMGTIAYYCASPFNLIFVLFPKNMMADAVMFMQLVKVGAMGVAFAFYLRKTRKTSDMLTVAFSLMYALSAYSVVNLMNPMWLDAMVFLPLLVLGTEKMIRERKFVTYTVALVLIFVTNYYIGYMCGIFTFFYFFYYYFLVRNELPQNKGALEGKGLKKLLSSRGFETFVRFGVFTVLALMISAFMLLSAWYSLQFGKTEFSNPNFSPTMRFDFIDLFVKLLPGSYDTVRPNGLPMIYSGMLAVIALPLFFMSKTITTKKKALTGGLLLFFLASFLVNTIDLAWHGFSAPNWLPYRYSFICSFVLIVMACDAIRGIKKIPFGLIAGSGVVIAILVMIIQKLDIGFEQVTGRINTVDDAKCILISLALIGIYLFILRYMKFDNMEKSGAFALAIIVCVEMFANSLITVGEVQMDVGTVRYDNYLSDNGKTEYYTGYQGSLRRMEGVVNEILENDDSFYRMESLVYRREGGVNEPMAHGYNGISHSNSTLNRSVITFMSTLGYASESHWTKYLGGTPVSDALLGIKYVVTKDDKLDENLYTVVAEEPEDYKYIPSNSTIYGMQNTKALSLVYGVSPEIKTLYDFNYPPYESALELQNTLVNTMLSGVMDTPNVLRGIYATFTTEGCWHKTYPHTTHRYYDEDGVLHTDGVSEYHVFKANSGAENCTVRYVFEAEADGPIYFHAYSMIFSTSAENLNIYVNGKKICDYQTNENQRIQKLGTFKKGETVEVEFRFAGKEIFFGSDSNYLFYYLDYDAINEAFAQLEYASMYVEEHGNDYLKGTITLPEGQDMIFTTIPYDEGWKVKIDGEEAETIKVLGTLLAIPSTAGFHEIEFVYRPNAAVYGGLLSVIGIMIFVAFLFWSRYMKLRGRETANGGVVHFFYYKGDEALGWTLEEAETAAAEAKETLTLPVVEVSVETNAPAEAEAPSEPEAPNTEE